MKQFLYRQSLVLFIIVLFIRGLLGAVTVKGAQMLNPDLTVQKDLGWLVMVVYAICTYLAVKWVKIDKEIGLVKPMNAKDWYVWTPALALPITVVSYLGFHSSWSHVPFLIIAAIGVAVNEEILFRGILLRALLPFGTAVAIVIPALLFGASHLGNILVGGDVTYGLLQFVWTFIAGMSIAALRLTSKSLYPAIVFHIILDGVEYAATGEFGVHNIHFSFTIIAVFIMINLALLLYALMNLKKNNTQIARKSNLKAL